MDHKMTTPIFPYGLLFVSGWVGQEQQQSDGSNPQKVS